MNGTDPINLIHYTGRVLAEQQESLIILLAKADIEEVSWNRRYQDNINFWLFNNA